MTQYYDLNISSEHHTAKIFSTLPKELVYAYTSSADFALPKHVHIRRHIELTPQAIRALQLKDTPQKPIEIISVTPTSLPHFITACMNLDIDIITMKMKGRWEFKAKFSSVQVAIQRGIVFEINVGEIFDAEPNVRTEMFTNAMEIVRLTRGRNVILSSGKIHHKGMADIMNFATLFGLNPSQAKDAVTSTPRSVIHHAKTRCMTYRAVMADGDVSAVPKYS